MAATDNAPKIDALGVQLSALLVQMATLTANVGGIRDDIQRQGDGHADHEARIRGLEANGCSSHADTLGKHDLRLSNLEQYRWKAAGIASGFTFLGGAGGAAIALLASALIR